MVADAIPVLFQKITRQMLCDKCSKNDVTLTLKMLTSMAGKLRWILKMLTSYGEKNLADPQNAGKITPDVRLHLLKISKILDIFN
jgi:hypothetical protein